jgi:uncharacterized protein (DUF2236 family)
MDAQSMIARYAGDLRLLPTAGYTLLLQVSHPTVGAGVRDHSDFVEDPWGRLLRTLDFVYLLTYADDEDAAATCRYVRDLHKRIKGFTPDGTRYHALEPEAYAWVHATLGEAFVTGHKRFGRPMRRWEVEQFWGEWRELGHYLGVRDRDLPPTWAGFQRYFDAMVADRLQDNQTVHDVLGALSRPAAPPVSVLDSRAWPVASRPAGHILSLVTVGLLPPTLRARFGLSWSRHQELELRALAAAARSTTPILPATLRDSGPLYLRWRREAIARTYLSEKAVA